MILIFIYSLNLNLTNIVPYTIADLGFFEGNINAVGIGEEWISRSNSVVWCTDNTKGTRPIGSDGAWFSLYTLNGGCGNLVQIAVIYGISKPLQVRMWVNNSWSDWDSFASNNQVKSKIFIANFDSNHQAIITIDEPVQSLISVGGWGSQTFPTFSVIDSTPTKFSIAIKEVTSNVVGEIYVVITYISA